MTQLINLIKYIYFTIIKFIMERTPEKISIDLLLKEFHCPVCLNFIDDCYVTKCGHTFCKNCISEAINRHHKCPLCQVELKEQDIGKNVSLNNLKKTIVEERDKIQKSYLANLANKMHIEKQEDDLERILIDGLKNYALLYRKYLDETYEQFEVSKEIIAEENKKNNSNKDLNQEIEKLSNQFEEVKSFVIDSLRQTLSNLVPDPRTLEVKCDIILPQASITLKDIFMKPSMKVGDIRQEIKTGLIKLNEPLSSFNDNVGYLIIIPPEKRKILSHLINKSIRIEVFKDLDNYVQDFNGHDVPIVEVTSESMLGGFKLKPNSAIIYVGDFKLKSESPPCCLTYDYKPGTIMDYFSCGQCGINWICKPCAEYCHKGHNLMPYLQNKATSWACCYCVKNHLCKALNKDNKETKQ